MLQAPAQLRLDRRSLALCRCMAIRLADGQILRVTTWTSNVDVVWQDGGDWWWSFRPGYVIAPKEERRVLDLRDNSYSFSLMIDEDFITTKMVDQGKFHTADVIIGMVDPYSPHWGFYWAHGYKITAVIMDGPIIQLECGGMTIPLANRMGHMWNTKCRNTFLDSLCDSQSDLTSRPHANYHPASITGGTNRGLFTARILANQLNAGTVTRMKEHPEWFWSGSVKFPQGTPNGNTVSTILRTREFVFVQVGGTPSAADYFDVRDIQLLEPPLEQTANGQSISLRGGCDRTNQTCRNRWENSPNFRGASETPGTDALIISPPAS